MGCSIYVIIHMTWIKQSCQDSKSDI
jgi:hypothetical protein